MLNEFRPRGVDARAPIALDHVPSTQLDDTDAPVAALLPSCQDAASQVREQRKAHQKAGCIARATPARARSTNAPIATWPNCDPRGGCSGCSKSVIDRFLKCGDPHHGFARIYCPGCRHDFLLAFSCKARYFCPSCHQKRVLAYEDWVEENVLGPVPHRQYVFTVPQMLRPIFSRRRGLLGELCHIVERLLIEAYSGAAVEGRPGLILFVQTFGDLVTFNPHIHVLTADGIFRADGVFVALPAVPVKLLEQGFRSEVLKLLVAEGAIGERLSASMLAWRHSGFSVHNGVRVRAGDVEGRKKLAQYMLRALGRRGRGSSTKSMKSILLNVPSAARRCT